MIWAIRSPYRSTFQWLFYYLCNKHRKVYLRTFDVQVLRLFALAENSAVFVLKYKPTLDFGFTQHLSSGAMQCWS